MREIERYISMPRVGISGTVASWEVVNSDGSIADRCYVPHKNTILNSGLDMLPTYTIDSDGLCPLYKCHIGTGTPSNPVPATDTALDSSAASGQIFNRFFTQSGTWAYQPYYSIVRSDNGASPYYTLISCGIETPYGLLNGTYGEIGFSNSGSKLFSKYRFLNELGNPTTVPVTSSQQLRVKYVLTLQYSPATPTSGQCYMKGISAEPNVEDFGHTDQWVDVNVIEGQMMLFSGRSAESYITLSDYQFQDIGTSQYAFSPPFSGIKGSITYGSYVEGSYERNISSVFATSIANGTVRAASFGYGNALCFVTKFNTPFTKYNTHRLTLNFKLSWGRA